MPELPEVEHVRKELERIIAGRRIATATLLRPRLAPDTSPSDFSKQAADTQIRSVGRRGKHLLFDLDNGRTLIVHLRMSGRFVLLSPDDPDPKFTHATFHFDDDSRLVFQDQRHFGLMKIVSTDGLAAVREIAKLAPEPFSDDFSPDYLAGVLRSSGRTLKELLLDQTKVCGVGNIYASEVLFLSAVSPRRRGRSLSRKRISVLYDNVKVVLDEAIQMMSTLIPDASSIGEGVYGRGDADRWRVYDNEGKPCPLCASPIKRIVQAGRSTYFCSKCQR